VKTFPFLPVRRERFFGNATPIHLGPFFFSATRPIPTPFRCSRVYSHDPLFFAARAARFVLINTLRVFLSVESPSGNWFPPPWGLASLSAIRHHTPSPPSLNCPYLFLFLTLIRLGGPPPLPFVSRISSRQRLAPVDSWTDKES